MIDESNIFGGKQWTKEQQFEDEIRAMAMQMKYTIKSYRKFKEGEKKKIEKFFNSFLPEEGEEFNESRWLDKHDTTSEYGGV